MRDANGYLIEDFINISDPTARIEDTAECRLWRNVLLQTVFDTVDNDEEIRFDAIGFINGPDILDLMDRAMIDRSMVGKLRDFVNAGKARRFRSVQYQVAA